MAFYMFPISANLPFWNAKGFIAVLTLHMAVSEPLYYWMHRFVLHGNTLFTHYHSLHHSSLVPQPFTGTDSNKDKTRYYYIVISFMQFDHLACIYKFTLFCCSWTCNLFGASYFSRNHWNSDSGGFFNGMWIDDHNLFLCFNL